MEGHNYSDINNTELDSCLFDVTTEERAGKILGYCIIIFFSILGNSLVVLVITRDHRMKSNTNRFIVNMCISDLFATVNVLPTQVMFILSNEIWLIPGTFGEFFCKLVPFIQDVSLAVSIFSMTIIALDRYLAIVYPYKTHVITTKRCFIIIAVIWTVAIGMHCHYFIIMDVVTSEFGDMYCRQVWSKDSEKHLKIQKVFFTANFAFAFATPLMSIAFFYTRVVMELYCRSGNLEQSREQRRVRNRENREVAVMLISVVALFVASWLPLNTLFFLLLYRWKLEASDPCYLKNLKFIVYLLGHSNVSQNSFIYFSFNKRFKNGLKKLFGGKCDLGAVNSPEYTNGTSTAGRNLRINSRAALQDEERIKLTTEV